MLCLFILSFFSTNQISSIRNQLYKKKYNEALQSAESMISQQGSFDVDNILFFLRGYAYVKINKFEKGISDLSHFLAKEKNINLNDKIDAYTLRSTAYIRVGKLEEAKRDAELIKDQSLIKLAKKAEFLLLSATSKEASPKYSLSKYAELIKICSHSIDFYRDAAKIALSIGNHTFFVQLSQKGLLLSPRDSRLIELKARYHFSNYEILKAEKYLKICSRFSTNSSNCNAMLQSINVYNKSISSAKSSISNKYYNQARKDVDICYPIIRKYSPDGSPISNEFKKIYVQVLIGQKDHENAIEVLNDLIKAYPENNKYRIQRGTILLEFNDYSGAISDFQIVRKRTNQYSSENAEADRLIKKASELQDKEKNVNYYTILGLNRGASLAEVKKAYKKLVIKWHPDRYSKPLQKKEAEKKMMMINKAYEVIGDESKKRLYDLGYDTDGQTQNNQSNDDDYSYSRNNNNNYNNNYNNNNNYNSNYNNNQYSYQYSSDDFFNEFFKDFDTFFKDFTRNSYSYSSKNNKNSYSNSYSSNSGRRKKTKSSGGFFNNAFKKMEDFKEKISRNK